MIFLIAALILAGIGGAAYLGYLATLPAGASVVEVPPTIAVDRGTVAQSVSAPGQLVAMREQILGFEVAGRLTQLNTRAGADVKAGDLLAQLSDSVYEYSLVAPFDGVIQEVRPIVGETLSAGAPVIQLLDAKALEARLTVTEEDYPLVEVGQRAQLYFDSQPDLIITGTVTAIAPLREAESDKPPLSSLRRARQHAGWLGPWYDGGQFDPDCRTSQCAAFAACANPANSEGPPRSRCGRMA